MSGDRSQYRDMYPKMLHTSKVEWKSLAEQANDPGMRKWTEHLAEDVERVNNNVDVVPWPDKSYPGDVQKITRGVCKVNFSVGFLSIFSRELRQPALNWKKAHLVTPVRRMIRSFSWKSTFDAMDLKLSAATYPIFEEVLDDTHDYILRAHSWFGVGEWGIANRHYLNALLWALGSNNLETVETIVRCLVDTYVANGNYQFAANLADEFSRSAYAKMAEHSFFMTRSATYESVVMGFALANQWIDVKAWLQLMQSEFNRELNKNITSWNISELLLDVYEFRQDRRAVARLRSAMLHIGEMLQGRIESEN